MIFSALRPKFGIDVFFTLIGKIYSMVMRVVKISRGGYKVGNIFV